MIRPIAVGGTGESYANDIRTAVPAGSMLSFVTNSLDPQYFNTAWWVGYPSAYGVPMSFEASVDAGLDALDAKVQAALTAGNKVVLLGYSQGAVIVRRYLAALAEGEYGDAENYTDLIVGAACVADPYRDQGNYIGAVDPGGYGLAGTTTFWQDGYLLEAAAERDPITAAPADSMLRIIADLTRFMSIDMRKVHEWFADMIKTIRDDGWQKANLDWGQFWVTGQRVQNAIDLAGGYFPLRKYKTMPWLPEIVINPGGGRHTCYATERVPGSNLTYCEMLAFEINYLAFKGHSA